MSYIITKKLIIEKLIQKIQNMPSATNFIPVNIKLVALNNVKNEYSHYIDVNFTDGEYKKRNIKHEDQQHVSTKILLDANGLNDDMTPIDEKFDNKRLEEVIEDEAYIQKYTDAMAELTINGIHELTIKEQKLKQTIAKFNNLDLILTRAIDKVEK